LPPIGLIEVLYRARYRVGQHPLSMQTVWPLESFPLRRQLQLEQRHKRHWDYETSQTLPSHPFDCQESETDRQIRRCIQGR
uniref:Transposase n=1 Tax=Hydatigena taeniaeformis TaxID=6205 RepID=A0A0R3WPK7_HYDTA